MSISQWFGFSASNEASELPEIFPMPILLSDFIRIDVAAIYSKILTDVLERIHGLTDDQVQLMWDNCVKSSKADGLITMLADAMANKKDLFVVFEQAVGVIREATFDEQVKIRADYEKAAESSVGVFISFKNYLRSDMVKLYSGLEYCSVSSLYKSMNLSKAVQLKVSDLRGSVSLTDSSKAIAQAKEVARSLASGKDILIDAKDVVETSSPDLDATEKSIEFIANKLSFYLGMPASYIAGEQTTGIGSTGEADQRAVERGLKGYYFSIMKPAIEAIFDATLSYKSQDFRHIQSGLDVLKAFAVTDEEFISRDNKTKIINQVFDLPEDAEGDPVPKAEPLPAPGAQPPQAPPGGAKA
jgi:hypothetical protein